MALFLIQLLNIAGVGPVFGPILGALYGPTALLWVVFGNIFAGAVHDYLSGMMSVRYHGANIPEIIRFTLGNKARGVMLLFTVLPLILAGVVFVTAPAGLLEKLCKDSFNGVLTFSVLVTLIFMYYFFATLLPIDKLIGRIYPFFGALLLVMALGLSIGLLVNNLSLKGEASKIRP